MIRSIFWILVFSVMPKRSLLVGAVLSAFLFGTGGSVTDGVYLWVPSAAAAPVVKELKSFAGEDGKEYRFDAAAGEDEATKKKFKFEENRWSKTMGGYFEDIAQEIADQGKKITDEAQKRAEFERQKMKAEDALDAGKCSQGGACDASEVVEKTYMDFVSKDGDRSHDELINQAAQFAADVIHSTGTLTKDEFEEDARTVANLLNKDTAQAFYAEMKKILKAHPEIYTVEPDADRKLDEMAARELGIGEVAEDPNGRVTYVFLSRSLGKSAIEQIFDRASHNERKDVVFVFRGVPEGMAIVDGVQEIQKIAIKFNPQPKVIIDPSLFKAHGVTTVPTVVRSTGESAFVQALKRRDGTDGDEKRDFGTTIAKVEGLDNDVWLMERIEAGERGDLGVHGDIRDISEPDLIDVMKAKVAAYDWTGKPEQVYRRAWNHQKFFILPTAEKGRIRTVDPTILVDKDIKDLTGRAIRKAGDRVNPLEIQPFTLTLLVFDPLSENEMRRVTRFMAREKMKGRPAPVLIATRIDKNVGWDSYTKLTDRLDQHVFLMPQEVKDQFQLEMTPSVVTADNTKHVFKIEELGPLENEADESGLSKEDVGEVR